MFNLWTSFYMWRTTLHLLRVVRWYQTVCSNTLAGSKCLSTIAQKGGKHLLRVQLSINPLNLFFFELLFKHRLCDAVSSLMLTYVFHNGFGHADHHLNTFLWWSCQQQWRTERRLSSPNYGERGKFSTSHFPIMETSETAPAAPLLLQGLPSWAVLLILVRKEHCCFLFL